MSGERPFILEHGASFIGELCPVCHVAFDAGDRVIACPRCKQLHHEDCWHEKGCAKLGCPQVATRLLESERPRITDDDRAKEYDKPLPRWVPVTAGFLVFMLLLGVPLLRKYVFADPRPKLTVMIPAGSDDRLIKLVAEEYGMLHPELQVDVIYGPTDDMYMQKLMIMIGARDAPDIFVLPFSQFSMLAAQGAYADLTAWVESEPEALQAIPERRLALGNVDGVWYGVPHPSRSLFFGVYAGSELIDPAIELLEDIIAILPVDPDLEDRLYSTPNLPPIRFTPGW